MCGSDVHTLTGGWGEARFPLCVGHEVIGKVVRKGEEVKSVEIGDRVGVGALGLLGMQSVQDRAGELLSSSSRWV